GLSGESGLGGDGGVSGESGVSGLGGEFGLGGLTGEGGEYGLFGEFGVSGLIGLVIEGAEKLTFAGSALATAFPDHVSRVIGPEVSTLAASPARDTPSMLWSFGASARATTLPPA